MPGKGSSKGVAGRTHRQLATPWEAAMHEVDWKLPETGHYALASHANKVAAVIMFIHDVGTVVSYGMGHDKAIDPAELGRLLRGPHANHKLVVWFVGRTSHFINVLRRSRRVYDRPVRVPWIVMHALRGKPVPDSALKPKPEYVVKAPMLPSLEKARLVRSQNRLAKKVREGGD